MNDRDVAATPGAGAQPLFSRRRFLGYLVAAPTLVAAARLSGDVWSPAPAAGEPAPPFPTIPEPADLYDGSDFLRDAMRPTANLITVQVNPDGTVSFALPRAEVGQGITTAIAMLIAEEMDLPLEQVTVTLADARPELVWNQFTAASNTIFTQYEPVRTAAAVARARLKVTAAELWGVPVSTLSARQGVIRGPGHTATYGSLAGAAAASTTTPIRVELKPPRDFTLVGTPQNRKDAPAIVTGRKLFAMDLEVAGAKPTTVRRAPTLGGTVQRVKNLDLVQGMPGVTDVAVIPTGVAVRAGTFGQCLKAAKALEVDWIPGQLPVKSDQEVLDALRRAETPMTQQLDPGGNSVEEAFTFYHRSGSALEPNCAVADVHPDRAEVWSSLKAPILAGQQIAQATGLPEDRVTIHVVEGGGSFGRRLFADAAVEAALVSKAMGKPVKLMWDRGDDIRHGRIHPMCTSRVRIRWSGSTVLSFELHHTSVETDFRHGFGEMLSANEAAQHPVYAQSVFHATVKCPYRFGRTDHRLTEVALPFPSGPVRNIFNPDVCTARELMVDQLAEAMGRDPLRLRRDFAKDDRSKAVLEKVAEAGDWGRAMAPGTAQGVALHDEYKSRVACLVEIDCRTEGGNHHLRRGGTGPRVTKAVMAVDVGLPVNPRGLQAQMMSGCMDGIAQALTYSLHLENGMFREGNWDRAFYTGQRNSPPELDIIVMPPTTEHPGGAGELGVPASMAAVACAYSRAVGRLQTTFPVNHPA